MTKSLEKKHTETESAKKQNSIALIVLQCLTNGDQELRKEHAMLERVGK